MEPEGIAAQLVPKGGGAAGFVQGDGAIVPDLVRSPTSFDGRPAVTALILSPRAVLERECYHRVVLGLAVIDHREGRVRFFLRATCGDEGPDPLVFRDLPRLPRSCARLVGWLS